MKKTGFLSESKPSKTVEQLFDDYKQANVGVLKDRSVRRYREDQRGFERLVGKDTPIREINEGDVDAFIKECKREKCRNRNCDKKDCRCVKKSLAKSTIGNQLKRVRQAFSYAVKNQWLESNPIVYDSKAFPIKVTEEKQKRQAEVLTEENVRHLLSMSQPNFEFYVFLRVFYYLGCRPAELAILRWSDIHFDSDDPSISLRSKDTEHNGRDRSKMPMRTCPLWHEIREPLEKLRSLNPNERFVFNNIGGLKSKPEFEITDPKTCERIREGRYETNLDQMMIRALKRAGIPNYPQKYKALRDVRANELTRLGFRTAEIDAWIGNTEAVRNKHYSGTAVTKKDRQKALEITADPNRVGENQNRVGIRESKNTQNDPTELIQELLGTEKGRELLEMLEKALKENDPADLEEGAKYSGSNGFRDDSLNSAQQSLGRGSNRLSFLPNGAGIISGLLFCSQP